MNYEEALALARHLVAVGIPLEESARNPAIPDEYRAQIEAQIREESVIELSPVKEINQGKKSSRWLDNTDRRNWYYWPRLRSYLIGKKKWPLNRVRSLDDSSDAVLRNLSPPEIQNFNTRGLVLGYVQSGKTANYTALIAKAVDVGYRLIIVLAGMDNGLRRQTQVRLQKELVGDSEDPTKSVALPDSGKHWHTFTTKDLNGDFRAGNVSTAALQGTQPVLLVVKKNTHVLKRMLKWLDKADTATFLNLPVLVIDDEADQASIDISSEEEPSAINQRIRSLLNKFSRCAYVAYTATPFANILIPANAQAPDIGDDLYPKDFIIGLPKPDGYVGAESLFGKSAFTGEEDEENGLDVIRIVPEQDVQTLQELTELPETLSKALLDFVLAGSAKAQLGNADEPATMLIHISHLIERHDTIYSLVSDKFREIQDEWRYFPENIGKELKFRWEKEFVPLLEQVGKESITFSDLEMHISKFLESVDIKAINSAKGDVADYEQEPSLKVIAIGGNKLSRGLTLEGLLVSYFTRSTDTYDTLMQMGRWFGYREEYKSLTRLYTTEDLANRFSHLALVEHQLREDLTIYENRNITPREVGMRILAHPAATARRRMSVTSPLKQTHAVSYKISYSESLFQTFRFPLNNPEDLAEAAESNVRAVKSFLANMGRHEKDEKESYVPLWRDILPEKILDFLRSYKNKEHENDLSAITEYIRRRSEDGELSKWTVAIRHLRSPKNVLGVVDWGIGINLNQMSRTRLMKQVNSLGVITNPGDEMIGLTKSLREKADEKARESGNMGKNKSARSVRPPDEGLLLLYPISKKSTPDKSKRGSRAPLFDNPDGPLAKDLVGVAISFPKSEREQPEEYISGSDPGSWEQNVD